MRITVVAVLIYRFVNLRENLHPPIVQFVSNKEFNFQDHSKVILGIYEMN